MPITVEHLPNYASVSAEAQVAGQMQGAAKRRSEIEQRQAQYDQMKNARMSQAMNMWSQERGQQQAMARQNLQGQYRQQEQTARNAQQTAMQAQQQVDKLSYLEQQYVNSTKLGQFNQDASVMEMGHHARAALEQTLGAIDPAMLTQVPGGGKQHLTSIQQELDDLDRGVQTGGTGEQDYYYSLQELIGRAKKFQSQSMYQPVRNPELEIREGEYVNKNNGQVYKLNPETMDWDNTGVYAEVNGVPVNMDSMGPGGNVYMYDNTGKRHEVWNAANAAQTLRKDINAAMGRQLTPYKGAASASSINAADGGGESTVTPSNSALGAGGNPTGLTPAEWMTKPGFNEQGLTYYQEEEERRFKVAWEQLQATAYNGVWKPGVDDAKADQSAQQQQGGAPAPGGAPQPGAAAAPPSQAAPSQAAPPQAAPPTTVGGLPPIELPPPTIESNDPVKLKMNQRRTFVRDLVKQADSRFGGSRYTKFRSKVDEIQKYFYEHQTKAWTPEMDEKWQEMFDDATKEKEDAIAGRRAAG